MEIIRFILNQDALAQLPGASNSQIRASILKDQGITVA